MMFFFSFSFFSHAPGSSPFLQKNLKEIKTFLVKQTMIYHTLNEIHFSCPAFKFPELNTKGKCFICLMNLFNILLLQLITGSRQNKNFFKSITCYPRLLLGRVSSLQEKAFQQKTFASNWLVFKENSKLKSAWKTGLPGSGMSLARWLATFLKHSFLISYYTSDTE